MRNWVNPNWLTNGRIKSLHVIHCNTALMQVMKQCMQFKYLVGHSHRSIKIKGNHYRSDDLDHDPERDCCW
jgi:hypothetical protein